jgi:hypothetical protein
LPNWRYWEDAVHKIGRHEAGDAILRAAFRKLYAAMEEVDLGDELTADVDLWRRPYFEAHYRLSWSE